MRPAKQIKKTGEFFVRTLAVSFALFNAASIIGVALPWSDKLPHAVAQAADDTISFTAEVDRTQITMDDSVSLKLSVKTEGNTRVTAPQFSAPDFEVINEYSNNMVESYYENGRFGMRNNQNLTKVLKPLKMGSLSISGIQLTAGGKPYTAPTIVVQVGAAGAGTPPPRGYGGGGVGLRGAGKHSNAPSVLVRAEVDKDKAYKGEQIVVSYYLYQRVRVFNISVDKFPDLKGFLREDLEMPVLGPRLESERIVLDGVPYERALLMRYAIYPLQEGKLHIDPVALKYQYYAQPGGGMGDDEDPFLKFFQQLAPRSANTRSEVMTVEVGPLPEAGKPQSFTGGVGDFSVTSAVDKYDVRANEAVTLTVKIEGRGNVAAVGEPKSKWPDNIELYDSKGTSKSGRGGVGQKTFEFLLIPRAAGQYTLPELEFSFFDPIKKEYVTRKTQSVSIHVGDPAPGSQAVGTAPKKPGADAQVQPGGPAVSAPAIPDEPRYLKSPGESGTIGLSGRPVWRWLYWLCVAAFGVFIVIVGFDAFKRGRSNARDLFAARAKLESKSWDRLRAGAKAAGDGASWQEVTQSYETLSGVLFDAIDRKYKVGARGLPRSELKELLVDGQGLASDTWDRIGKLLEFAEMVRFATSAGAVSETVARGDLKKWVAEGESLVRSLDTRKS